MKANLLVHIESFHWDDLETDRSKEMDDLMEALGKENEDKIFSHPHCYLIEIKGWGEFHNLLTLDEEGRNVWTKGWFTHKHQETLINLWKRSASPKLSNNHTELNKEFVNSNNGLVGFNVAPPIPWQVYSKPSWVEFHRHFVKLHLDLRYSHPDYFKRYYVPALTESANQINTKIRKGQSHPFFLRLDDATHIENDKTLHGEKIQMHFNDKGLSALNIDGSWKHGKCEIPSDAKQQLEDWGFLLPE